MARQGKVKDTALEVLRLVKAAGSRVDTGMLGCGAGALQVAPHDDLRLHTVALQYLLGDMLLDCARAARSDSERARIMALHDKWRADSNSILYPVTGG